MSPTVRDRITVLDTTLAELDSRLLRLADKETELERKLTRLARGTMNGEQLAQAPQAEETKPEAPRARRGREVTPPPGPSTLDERLEGLLRSRALSTTEAARALGTSVGRASLLISRYRKARKVYNLGTAEAPRWTWLVGDDCSPDELRAAVRTMLTDRPMTFTELLAATGARRGRVSGQIVDLQRTGQPVVNLGSERRARWFMPVRPGVETP